MADTEAGMTAISLVVPLPMMWSSNQLLRLHATQRRTTMSSHRQRTRSVAESRLEAIDVSVPLERPVVIKAWPITPSRCDVDAIATILKPTIDGVVDAGILRDDTPDEIHSITMCGYSYDKFAHVPRLVVFIAPYRTTVMITQVDNPMDNRGCD